jgi:NADH-quinone oxidoreductase subunit E
MEATMKLKLDEVLGHYEPDSNQLIPILQESQETFGYLPAEVIQGVANYVHLPEVHVFGVATFYAMFKLKPTGKRIVTVCRGTACHVRGGARILSEVQRRLGVKPGDTTPDREYTLETVACIGACALAPTMVINKETYGEMTIKKVAEMFGDKGGTK